MKTQKIAASLIIVCIAAFFASLLYLIPFSSADYDAWHYHKNSFIYDDTNYTLKVLAEYTAIRIETASGSFSIKNGTCHQSAFKTYCYEGADFSEAKMVIDELGNLIWPVHFKIQDKPTSLKTTRTLSTASPKYGREFNITVTLENDGALEIENIFYEEKIPSGVIFIKAEGGAQKIGNSILWSLGFLDADKTASFSYTLKPQAYGSSSFSPSLEYTSPLGSEKESPSALSITVADPYSSPYTLVQTLFPSNIIIGEDSKWSVTLTNTVPNETLEAEMTLSVPLAVLYTGKTGDVAEKPNRKFEFKKSMPGLTTETLTFSVEGFKSGTYSFTGFFEGTMLDTNLDRNVFLNKSFSSTLTVTLPQIVPILHITPDDTTPGQPLKVKLILDNPSEQTFFNVSGTLDLGFVNESISLPHIYLKDKYTFEKEYFLLAGALAQKAKFSGSFYSVNGERSSISKEEPMRIVPFNESIDIVQSFNATSAKRGDTIKASIKAKNKMDQNLKIVAYDKYPGTLEVSGGTQYIDVTIVGGEERELYSYTINIPQDFAYTNFIIATAMTYPATPSALKTASSTITITDPIENAAEAPVPVIEVPATSGENSSLPSQETSPPAPPSTQPESNPTEKKGFWTSIIAYIANFFK